MKPIELPFPISSSQKDLLYKCRKYNDITPGNIEEHSQVVIEIKPKRKNTDKATSSKIVPDDNLEIKKEENIV